MRLRIALASIVIALAVAACGGNGDDEQDPTATTVTGAPATEAAIEQPTSLPEGGAPVATTPPTTSFSLCLIEPEDADEALDEFVTGFPGGNLNCTFQTESGSYLRFELGSSEDFEPNAELAGVGSDPVAGVGEEAVWFDGVEFPSHHFDFDEQVTLGVLSLRQGDVYIRIMINRPELDSAAQQELAIDLAAIALPQLP